MSPNATFSLDVADGAGTGALEAKPFFGRESEAQGRDSRMLNAASGSLNPSCVSDGALVTCDIEDTNLFHLGPQLKHTQVFTVEGGAITAYHVTRTQGLLHRITNFDVTRVAAYERWLQETHPEDHSALFFLTTMLLNDMAQVERHRDLVAEWASSGR
jgi:hypothetical protein